MSTSDRDDESDAGRGDVFSVEEIENEGVEDVRDLFQEDTEGGDKQPDEPKAGNSKKNDEKAEPSPSTSKKSTAKRQRRSKSGKSTPPYPSTRKDRAEVKEKTHRKVDELDNRRRNERVKEFCSRITREAEAQQKDFPDNLELSFAAKFTPFKKSSQPGAAITWNFGKPSTPEYITLAQVREIMEELRNMPPADVAPTTSAPTAEPTASTSATTVHQEHATPTKTSTAAVIFPSPPKRTFVQTPRCSKKTCAFPKKSGVEEVWIACEFVSADGKNCEYWIHAFCLGFPAATEEQVSNMPAYYCPTHLHGYKK
ncbi:unnamed protein product [Orchesella dallaii]|uniref:Zinc finger PHD-type domain-containing protein n=1 Tax=Orchesella dallaii TaxID=48710 RepID=A0ABP1QQH1_9HEXA